MQIQTECQTETRITVVGHLIVWPMLCYTQTHRHTYDSVFLENQAEGLGLKNPMGKLKVEFTLNGKFVGQINVNDCK